jgi:hypothetical protein
MRLGVRRIVLAIGAAALPVILVLGTSAISAGPLGALDAPAQRVVDNAVRNGGEAPVPCSASPCGSPSVSPTSDSDAGVSGSPTSTATVGQAGTDSGGSGVDRETSDAAGRSGGDD